MDRAVYIKTDKCILIDSKCVRVRDVADIRCNDDKITDKVGNILLYTFESDAYKRYVMSVMDIISAVQKQFPDVVVINVGETDFIIEYNTSHKEKVWMEVLKVSVIAMIVFFGSAFSIMSFHEDVGITGLFEDVYEFIMGKEKEEVSVIEVTYSIGLFLGILIFYNRFGMSRTNNEPTPLEMEMKTYEDTVNDTLIMAGDRSGTD